jgi:hypothetical protein
VRRSESWCFGGGARGSGRADRLTVDVAVQHVLSIWTAQGSHRCTVPRPHIVTVTCTRSLITSSEVGTKEGGLVAQNLAAYDRLGRGYGWRVGGRRRRGVRRRGGRGLGRRCGWYWDTIYHLTIRVRSSNTTSSPNCSRRRHSQDNRQGSYY